MHTLSSLIVFDFVFLGIIAVSVIFGLIRGCIKSAISLIGWVISAMIALHFSHHLLPLIEKYGFSHSLSQVMAVIATFVGSAIIIAIFNSVFVSCIRVVCGGLIDRSCGLAFGFVRGCAIASVMFYVLTLLFPVLYISTSAEGGQANLPEWAKGSKSINLLSRGADVFSSFLPQNFKKDLKESIDETIVENEKQLKSSDSKSSAKTPSQVLKSLPPEVVDEISADDILVLQDSSASPAAKVKILDSVANQYHQYVNKEAPTTESATPPEHDQEYYDVMKSIEELISHYNSTNSTKH